MPATAAVEAVAGVVGVAVAVVFGGVGAGVDAGAGVPTAAAAGAAELCGAVAVAKLLEAEAGLSVAAVGAVPALASVALSCKKGFKRLKAHRRLGLGLLLLATRSLPAQRVQHRIAKTGPLSLRCTSVTSLSLAAAAGSTFNRSRLQTMPSLVLESWEHRMF